VIGDLEREKKKKKKKKKKKRIPWAIQEHNRLCCHSAFKLTHETTIEIFALVSAATDLFAIKLLAAHRRACYSTTINYKGKQRKE
jgi:hypothetical protein